MQSAIYNQHFSKLQNKDQLSGGFAYLGGLNDRQPDWADFEAASGLGVEVCPDL